MPRPIPEGYASLNPDLTDEEKTMLQLYASGHTIKQVARELGLGHSHVRHARERLMRKLGVSDLTGLLGRAYQLGYLAPIDS